MPEIDTPGYLIDTNWHRWYRELGHDRVVSEKNLTEMERGHELRIASGNFGGFSKHGAQPRKRSIFERALEKAALLDRVGMRLLRFGLVLVLCWIGGLKFAAYEADGIVPFVANSPLMSFFYHHPAPEYRMYMNKEGELNSAHRQWHESNGTYVFAEGLGIVIVGIGLLIA